MEKSTQWAPENSISPLSWCAMLVRYATLHRLIYL